MTRVKDQANSQFTYATDWDGNFSENNANGPQYMRSAFGGGTDTFSAMIDKYITNTDVMFCPLMFNLGNYFEKRYYTSGYGGWDTREWCGLSDSNGVNWDPSGGPPSQVQSGYCWFANFRRGDDLGGFSKATFLDGEAPWPKNMSECSSRAGFISHELSTNGVLDTDLVYWDLTHGGGWETYLQPVEELTSEDSPVCYADGSVIFNKKNEMRPRANVPFGGDYFYWY